MLTLHLLRSELTAAETQLDWLARVEAMCNRRKLTLPQLITETRSHMLDLESELAAAERERIGV